MGKRQLDRDQRSTVLTHPQPMSDPKRPALDDDAGLPWVRSPQHLWLIGAAIATMILWQLPWGHQVLYPFSILATWFHEMGHGVAAMLLGGRFETLLLHPSGGGVAQHSGQLWLGPIGRALVSAGGPLGAPLAGYGLLRLSQKRLPRVQLGLFLLGCALLLSVLLWVRTLFGVLAIGAWGIAIALIPLYGAPWVQYFALQFLSVQACISTFSRLDYLFTENCTIEGVSMVSDTGQMAKQLWLPYWFWGVLLAAISLYCVGSGLWRLVRSRPDGF